MLTSTSRPLHALLEGVPCSADCFTNPIYKLLPGQFIFDEAYLLKPLSFFFGHCDCYSNLFHAKSLPTLFALGARLSIRLNSGDNVRARIRLGGQGGSRVHCKRGLGGVIVLLTYNCVLNASTGQCISYIKPCNFIICLDCKYHIFILMAIIREPPNGCFTCGWAGLNPL